MRLVPRRWSSETWFCSMSGHVAPAAGARELRSSDRALGVDLSDGTRMARCLRCDCWLAVPPGSVRVAYDVVPPLAELDLPLRGRPLEDRVVVRAIALERLLHVILFTTLAVAAVLVELRIDGMRSWAEGLLEAIREQTSRGASHGWLARRLEELADVQRGTLWVVALASGMYAAVETVEAVGLWRGRRWAEYLTVAMTAVFLPFEVRELSEGVSPLKLGAFVLNVAVVAWLVWNKRLFGLRGGGAALVEQVDWDAVLGHPAAPVLERDS